MYLNGCNFVTNQAASSLVKVCGNTLEKIILTEATSLDSQILRDLARHAGKLEEMTLSNCTSIRLRDLQVLTEALWGSLRWLDLSSCRGISSFPVCSRFTPYWTVFSLNLANRMLQVCLSFKYLFWTGRKLTTMACDGYLKSLRHFVTFPCRTVVLFPMMESLLLQRPTCQKDVQVWSLST